MRGKSFSNEFRSQIVKEVEEVGNISLVCRKHGLKPGTVHGWLHRIKNKDQIAEKKTLRELQRKLKDKELENEVLKSLLKKTYPLWNKGGELS